jgi:hypothetical protein
VTIGTGSGMAQAKGSLLGRVYFDSTESNLTRGSRTTLKRMVNDLQAMGLRTVGVNWLHRHSRLAALQREAQPRAREHRADLPRAQYQGAHPRAQAVRGASADQERVQEARTLAEQAG